MRGAAISAAVVCAMAAGCSSSGSTQSGSGSGSTSTASGAGTLQLTINSGAMEPALKQGQVIVVTRVPKDYQPHRGDIVVFHDPGNWLSDHAKGDTLVKRVVGLPGEEVQCRQPQGQVVVRPPRIRQCTSGCPRRRPSSR